MQYSLFPRRGTKAKMSILTESRKVKVVQGRQGSSQATCSKGRYGMAEELGVACNEEVCVRFIPSGGPGPVPTLVLQRPIPAPQNPTLGLGLSAFSTISVSLVSGATNKN